MAWNFDILSELEEIYGQYATKSECPVATNY